MNITNQVLEGIIHDFVKSLQLFVLEFFGTGVGLETDRALLTLSVGFVLLYHFQRVTG